MEGKFICNQCGSVVYPEKQIKGSFAIELFLWLLMILPGVIYSVWRLTTKQWGCPKCGNPNLIPLDSPMGQKLAKEINSNS
jgi:predicted nucleic-acid-binding Zn-ribbon protein